MPRRGALSTTGSKRASSVPEVRFASRDGLRAWLETQHACHGPIWLVHEKKRADGQRVLTYDEIVEEAICFGWIDSVAGRVDDRWTKVYLSPRKPGSVWSALNKRRVERLAAGNRIAPAGWRTIEAAKADGSWAALDAAEALEMPEDLNHALADNPRAREHFEAFPRGVRRNILAWIASAKRAETRARRVGETVRLASQNIRANHANRSNSGG